MTGTPEIFRLMRAHGTGYCPTLAATDAIARYRGWNGAAPEPEAIRGKRASFAAALAAGVTMCMGGDVGVFAHGENAREMELMAAWGMRPADVLIAATSGNARHLPSRRPVGAVGPACSPTWSRSTAIRPATSAPCARVRLVMKGGAIVARGRRR